MSRNKQNFSFTFIDLFSGIGGLRLCFEKVGGKCVMSSEIDKKAKTTYQRNFNEIPRGDILKIKSKNIPNHDFLLAGFPCQPFSFAGYRKGLKDTRGGLFFEIIRILKDKQPKGFLLENVKGILSLEKGKTFKHMISSLQNIGYKIHYEVLNSKDYGNIPQTRERIYIVGFLYETNFRFPKKTPLKKSIKDILFKNKQDLSFYYDKYDIYKILKKEIQKRNTIYQWRRKYVRENKSNVCPTLTANMGTGGHNIPLIKDRFGIRKLTPRECAKFQGFPEKFILPKELSNCHLYKQIGNSVSIPVVKKIAKEMKKCLNTKTNYSNH